MFDVSNPSFAPPIRASAAFARMCTPAAVVVMGVSGCGKSSVAVALAQRLACPYVEGDALHPPANIAKMSAGIALDDDDRAPWLARIAQEIDTWRRPARRPAQTSSAGSIGGVVTCSALRRRYRDALADGHGDLCFVHLIGDRALILQRVQQRPGHFMPASLLDSQYATLEAPGDDEAVLDVPVQMALDDMILHLERHLRPASAAEVDAKVVEGVRALIA